MVIKTIGIDLDETLVKLYPALKKIYSYNKIKYVPVKTLDGKGIPDKVRIGIQEALKNPDVMCHLKLYPFVMEKLLYLKKVKKCKLVIVTSRHDDIKEQTLHWLHKRFPVVDDVIITPPLFKIKRDTLLKNKIDLWIDDNPIEIEDVMNDIPCIMISNRNTRYNHYLRHKVPFVQYFFQINLNPFSR
ncbi:MAG: hypothetical protein JXJ04_13300 [Spirochaetales bacterium]|nr:hypothetical protein [Spirochaetales bacterium]